MIKNTGHTIYACWGKYAGFHFEWNKTAKRLVIGKFVIGIFHFDVEHTLGVIVDSLTTLNEE